MKKSMKMLTMIVFCLSVSVTTFAVEYTSGHADLGVNYVGGQWDLHFHGHGGLEGAVIDGATLTGDGEEYEPDEVITIVPDHAIETRLTGTQYDFIGVSGGQNYWNLPQQHDEDDHDHDYKAPFFGIGAEEMATGIFVNDEVTLSLISVSGPGEFSLWQSDSFGGPIAYMTSTGATVEALTVTAGIHDHYNWSFTEAGTYYVTIQAYGDLVGGGSTLGQATYAFEVIPEPATLSLLALGGVALLRKRK